jgi:hypothetical protein
MSLKRLRCLFGLVLALGCTEAPTDGFKDPTAVAPASEDTGNVQGPIATTLSGPARVRPGEQLELTLRIDRQRLADSAEVTVQLTLPRQVTLQRGSLNTRVLPDGVRVAELHYAVQIGALPDEELTFSVSAVGEGFGYHAVLPYRFGLESALPSAPARSGGALRVGARSFGAAVAIPPLP